MPSDDESQNDSSTVCSILTPTATATAIGDDYDLKEHISPPLGFPSTPRPGCVFEIRCTNSERSLTLRDGQVVLAHRRDNRDSALWMCVESKGWLGFRNLVSGKYLGFNKRHQLVCFADHHLGWEYFCTRPMMRGGVALLMNHWAALWVVNVLENVVDGEGERSTLAKTDDAIDKGVAWEFYEVA